MPRKSLKFDLIINAALEIKGDKAQVVVKSVKANPATLSLPIEAAPEKKAKDKPVRKSLGKTLHEIVLESAKKMTKKGSDGGFSSADLFKTARMKYPELNKKSFNISVISAAPEHTSWKYSKNGKDYLVYLGKGKYKLREEQQ